MKTIENYYIYLHLIRECLPRNFWKSFSIAVFGVPYWLMLTALGMGCLMGIIWGIFLIFTQQIPQLLHFWGTGDWVDSSALAVAAGICKEEATLFACIVARGVYVPFELYQVVDFFLRALSPGFLSLFGSLFGFAAIGILGYGDGLEETVWSSFHDALRIKNLAFASMRFIISPTPKLMEHLNETSRQHFGRTFDEWADGIPKLKDFSTYEDWKMAVEECTTARPKIAVECEKTHWEKRA